MSRWLNFWFLIFTLSFSQIALSDSKVEIDAQIDEVLQKLFEFSPAAKTLAGKAEGILVFPKHYKSRLDNWWILRRRRIACL